MPNSDTVSRKDMKMMQVALYDSQTHNNASTQIYWITNGSDNYFSNGHG